MIIAAVAVGGVLVGVLLTLAADWFMNLYWDAKHGHAPAPKPDGPPKATCACGHIRSMHTDGSGTCQSWPDGTHRAEDKRVLKCPCQLYDGPEPVLYVEPRPVGDH